MDLKYIRTVVEEVTRQDISRACRDNEVVLARYVYFYICRSLTRCSYSKIGQSVNKDHATVLHGVRKMNDWLEIDKTVRALYDAVMDVISKTKPYGDLYGRDYDYVFAEAVRLRKINTEVIVTNMELREYINRLENIIIKRADYLQEEGYVKNKARAGTGYKEKVRKQVQLESAELGL